MDDVPEMVKRLARKLAGRNADTWVSDETPQIGSPSGRMLHLTPDRASMRPFWQEFIPLVVSVLEGLREPTADMIDAGYTKLLGDTFQRPREPMNAWQAMIDKALGR